MSTNNTEETSLSAFERRSQRDRLQRASEMVRDAMDDACRKNTVLICETVQEKLATIDAEACLDEEDRLAIYDAVQSLKSIEEISQTGKQTKEAVREARQLIDDMAATPEVGLGGDRP